MEAVIEKQLIHKLISSTVKEVKGKDRVLEFIGTTESQDRDGEVIKASAWQVDKYTANPVVQWAHNYQEPPIGKTISIRQSKGNTIFEIEFADKDTYEFADTIFKLCKGGFLNATSVGFIPLEWDRGQKESEPARTFTKVELLEISIVPVPSNPDALVTARNAGVITMKEFKAVSKVAKNDKSEDLILNNLRGNFIIREPHEARPTTQEELADNLDFTLSLVKTVGLSDSVKSKALELSNEIRRLTGSDIPVVIKDSPIKSMLEPVMKAIADHHADHNKCHDSVMKMLKDMCDSGAAPDPAHPEMPDGDEKSIEDSETIAEIIKQILNTEEKC